jgi:hypothetical protein
VTGTDGPPDAGPSPARPRRERASAAHILTAARHVSAESYAGAIYGTIVATSVIAGVSEDEDVTSRDILLATIGTTVVFWIAHVYARILGERAERRAPLTREQMWGIARTEWPMVESGVLIAIPPALAALGVWSSEFGAELAIWLGVGVLFACGFLLARRERLRLRGALLAGTVNALLGLIVVLLKTLVH